MATDAVLGRELLHVDNDSDEIAQASLMQHRTLGLACRARGVNHIGQTIGSRAVDGRCSGKVGLGHEVIDEEYLSGGGVEVALGLLGCKNVVAGDEYFRFRVLKHIAQTLIGILKVEWGIGGSSLVDGKHCQWEFLGAVEHDAHKVVALHIVVDELPCQ